MEPVQTEPCPNPLNLFALDCGVGETVELLPAGETPECDKRTVVDLNADPEIMDCVGVGPRNCLDVDGYFFYDTIEGFDYKQEFHYVISMEHCDAWPDGEEPPQDASAYSYRLVENLEKVQGP